MPYVRVKAVAGDVVFEWKYYASRYGKGGSPPGERQAKTSDAQKRRNLKRQERYLALLLDENFHLYRDGLLTLGWRADSKPTDYEEMMDGVRRFIRTLRPKYKAAGLELRYVYTLETGPRGARHVHMVISHSGAMQAEIMKAWKGSANVRPLYGNDSGEREFSQLAEYLMKDAYTSGSEKVGRRHYTPSKNLKKPKIITEVVMANTFSEKLRPRKGYHLDEHSVRSGIHEETGRAYMEYRYIRDRKGGDDG